MANPDALHDNPRSPKPKKTGPYSEPVDPEDLADDAGDMSLNPDDPGEKLRRAGAEKRKEQKKKAKPD